MQDGCQTISKPVDFIESQKLRKVFNSRFVRYNQKFGEMTARKFDLAIIIDEMEIK